VCGLLRSNPQVSNEAETGEMLVNEDPMSASPFADEFGEMAELSVFFDRCYIQLIHRPPTM
jgi:hypothetical protein